MSPQRSEDYILRQIQAVGQMLARAIGLRAQGQHEEARRELQQSHELLLGPQSLIVRSLDVATAATCLGSPEMILAYARLVDEEAVQEQDVERRASLRARAVALAETAARQYPEDEDLAREASEIVSPGRNDQKPPH